MQPSALQLARAAYQPKLPKVFVENGACVGVLEGDSTRSVADEAKIREIFPQNYGKPMLRFSPEAPAMKSPAPFTMGVILSGGQAPGGHNVISGLYDGLKNLNPQNRLLGFLGGPKGLLDKKYLELDGTLVDAYRNTGGFDMIGSGRDKIESDDDKQKALDACINLGIQALIVIGGDDSNTNACVLAEYFLAQGATIQVVGCPKTIDGDLKNAWIEASFGFDTACRVYSELIGNICRDALSAKKYWHFIKLMGRSASHIALECALQTQPNVTLISEEVEAKKKTLPQIANDLADVVIARSRAGKSFGIVLIPEGLIEFMPEMKPLIATLNRLLSAADADATLVETLRSSEDQAALAAAGLSVENIAALLSLPGMIREQLFLDRDPHGNLQVSRIETEKLLILAVKEVLKERGEKIKFSAHAHFFGYEGRCAQPSNFDADYCYSLGYTAAALVGAGKTGYLASVRHLTRPAAEWVPGGIPLTAMMNVEERHGKDKPVIRKALVELDGAPFQALVAKREDWAQDEHYVFVGPIQYFGPAEVCDQPSKTLSLEAAGRA